ncbi:MAG: hypothetical protein HY673_23275 [Chloroflexi bacterium]|nr:hypothetical protein [Chloroflexota bacterium]
MSTIAVASIIGLVVVVVLVLIIWSSRYVKVGPHEAMIMTGAGGQRVVIAGATFVMPVLYKMYRLDLRAHTVPVEREQIYTKNRVPVKVEAALVYKIKGTEEAVKLAAQSLQEKTTQDVSEMIQSVAEGAFRDICGKMTPEQINEDREEFQKQVTEAARVHFDKIGIDLISFVVKQISDPNNYFNNLGAPRLAEVERDARQRKAEADRAATVTEVEQKQASEVRRAETEAEILMAQRDRAVREQQYKADVAVETARAEQSKPRAEATAKQEVVAQQIILAEREAERKQKELLATVVRPAEAERDASVAKAEGDKKSVVLKATGEAERIKITGQADGEASQAKGEGEAAAIKAKLVAEADGLERKADAMTKFTDATMKLEIAKELIRNLPELVKAVAAPIQAIDSIKIVDFGSGNGDRAAGGSNPVERLLGLSPKTLAIADETLKTTLGMSLADMVQLARKGDVTGLTKPAEDNPTQ